MVIYILEFSTTYSVFRSVIIVCQTDYFVLPIPPPGFCLSPALPEAGAATTE